MSELPATPLFPQVGVLSLVPDDWSPYWQPRHHVLSRLAQYFHVVWMNPARNWRRGFAGPDNAARVPSPRSAPGFQIYNPDWWLPQFYRPGWLGRSTERLRMGRALSMLRRKRCRKIVLDLWRPEFISALDYGKFDLICYHIDDEYTFSSTDQPITPAESRLLAAADQVFVHSPGLMEKKGTLNRCTLRIPNGVDYCAYSQPHPEPSDLSPIPHPRIGYTGWIKRQLDWDLLTDLAAMAPNWNFVFVGAINRRHDIGGYLDALRSRPNVHFLGEKTSEQLAAYPQHFDVCIMPYRMNDYTKYIYPMKLPEYLASGKPTVGSPIRSLLEFAAVVSLASTPKEWSAAIAEALTPGAHSAERSEERRAVARQHNWDQVVGRIATTIVQRLDLDASKIAEQQRAEEERLLALHATGPGIG
jgi:glycosyltransferase involved in cell wall biosynthesis